MRLKTTRRGFRSRLGLSALTLLTAGALACGDDDPASPGGGGGGGGGTGGDPGTFTATATGDLSGDFAGNAVFAIVPTGDAPSGEVFGLSMGGDGLGLNLFIDGSRPAAGTYQVGGSGTEITSGTGLGVLTYTSDGSFATGVVTSGQIVVTSSTSSQVDGSLNLTISLTFGGGASGSTTISGDFAGITGVVPPPDL